VLCHLDIAPRNILLCDDGEIFVLDWASVGFYPRIFELCSQMIMGRKDGKFNSLVLNAMQDPDEDERSQLELLLMAWRGMQRYSL
jgi:thiamine kinase-like enzyme